MNSSEAVSPFLGDQHETVISRRASSHDSGDPLGPPLLNAAATSSEMGTLLEGSELGHFLLQKFVGGGGMGAVFRAVDRRLGRTVAVKVLSRDRTDEDTLRRFQNEAQSAARLDHQNIARVYYVGEDRGLHFIVFEFIEGANIRDLVQQKGPLPLEEAISYVLQVAEALEHASLRNVIHRDIKPSNVLVTADRRAKLVDMGLARLHQMESETNDLTASGVTLGTFDYISPEQARDPRTADVRSDLYSLGCTFYYMLTGRPPFPDGTVLQKLLSHSSDEPTDPRILRPDLDEQIVQVLARLLAKHPSRRFQRPNELIGQLLLIAERLNMPSIARSGTVWVAPRKTALARLERALPWAVPAALFAVLTALVLSLWTPGEPFEFEQPPISLQPPKVPPAAAAGPIRPDPPPAAAEAVEFTSDTPPAEAPAESLPPGLDAAVAPPLAAPRAAADERPPADISGETDAAAPPREGSTGGTSAVAPPAGPAPAPPLPAEADPPAANITPPAATVAGPSAGTTAAAEEPNSAASAAPPAAERAPEPGGSPPAASQESPLEPTAASHDLSAARTPGAEALPLGDDAAETPAGYSRIVVGEVAAEWPADTLAASTLGEACGAAQRLGLTKIELHFDGPREEPALEIGQGDLAITAASGYQPLVVFRPTGTPAGSNPAIIRCNGTRLSWRGVHVLLDLGDAASDGWALFRLRPYTSLDVRDAVFTIRNLDPDGQIRLDRVRFFALEPRPAAAGPALAPLVHHVDLNNAILRGQADVLQAEQATAFRLLLQQSLVVARGWLVDVEGSPTKPSLQEGRIDLVLKNVTAVLHDGLCRLANDAAAPYQLDLHTEVSDSILYVTRAAAPLFERTGAGRLADVEKRLDLRGRDNFYPGSTRILRLQPDSRFDKPLDFDFEERDQLTFLEEKSPGFMVMWEELPAAELTEDQHAAEHYRLDESEFNAGVAAGHAQAVGADINRLPRPPAPPAPVASAGPPPADGATQRQQTGS